jgi:hypothetical protein
MTHSGFPAPALNAFRFFETTLSRFRSEERESKHVGDHFRTGMRDLWGLCSRDWCVDDREDSLHASGFDQEDWGLLEMISGREAA